MNEQELLSAITANLDGLRTELTLPEFFFEIGLDGSSHEAEIEIARTLRSVSFRQRLNETNINFNLYRNGKIEFIEVADVE